MLSVFDMFKIGVGPSSSHTVGPMKAALCFVTRLRERGLMDSIQSVRIGLYGSLAATGRGHATDTAVLLGLSGNAPDTVDVDQVSSILAKLKLLKIGALVRISVCRIKIAMAAACPAADEWSWPRAAPI